jgi:anti-sigma regulatory factor (Ser/Thr protein kinase)
MDRSAHDGNRLPDGGPAAVSKAFEGNRGDIALGREAARAFLVQLRSVHGVLVSARAVDTIQLVVSELLTNAVKYAPGPCLLDLELAGDRVVVTVWDSAPALPVARGAVPERIGQHGLEIVVAVCQSFDVHREPVGKRTIATMVLADDPAEGTTRHQP